MDRALPGRIIDLIHDGPSRPDLLAKGDRAVWAALLSSANSAVQRGWTQTEWASLVLDPRHELGRLARLKNGKPRGALRTEQLLESAWNKAKDWLEQAEPARTPVEMAEEAARRYELAMTAVGDPERLLSGNQRAVLEFVAERASKIGTLRVAISQRMLLESVHLKQTAARNALERLCRLGYLELVENGRPGGARTKERRANVYAVASALPAAASIPVPEAGMWCSGGMTSGAPTSASSGAPGPTSGAPIPDENSREEHRMIKLTWSPDGDISVTMPDATPWEVIEALRAKSVGVVLASNLHDDTVTPLFGRRSDPRPEVSTPGASS